MISTKLRHAASVAVKEYIILDAKETCLVMYDSQMENIARALRDAGREITDDIFFLEIPAMNMNADEPPNQLIDIMRSFDVVIAVTTKSITHTGPRHQATKGGVRVATIPEMSEESFIRNMDADRNRIEELNDKLAEELTGANILHVTSDSGTDIKCVITERPPMKSSGRLHLVGAWGNLPSGEVYIAPIEEETNGVLVVDGSIAEVGLVPFPVTIEIADGTIIGIDGKGSAAPKFQKLMDGLELEARTIGEFGIGTNYKAQITGHIAEDEKVLGTCHFAFGNNFSFGGTLSPPSHIDCVIMNPTITIDDKVIMEKGKITID